MTRLLHDNITEGTGTAAYTGCAGQAGKTGTTDEYTDAWFAGYQPNLATVVWVGYPESNDISMSSVHGMTVFGGTFPAEIWHSLYSGAGVPCEEFEEPSQQISWAPFYGRYARSSPSDDAQPRAASGGRRRRRTAAARQRRGRRLRPRRLRPGRGTGTVSRAARPRARRRRRRRRIRGQVARDRPRARLSA